MTSTGLVKPGIDVMVFPRRFCDSDYANIIVLLEQRERDVATVSETVM